MRDPRVRAERHAAGFTLIELVLALVIFSLLALMMYGAFFLGHRAVIKGEREADLNQRMRVAEDILGRQIRSAVFYFARHEEDTFPFFLGSPDRVTFVTASPQSHGGTGLAVVTYQVTNDGQLTLEERTSFTPDDLYDPPPDAAVERAVLFPAVGGARFEYIGHEEADNGAQPNWDARDEDALPATVRLTVDGLEFFRLRPWVRDIPLMTIVSGWGTDDFQEPPDEDEDQETSDEDDEDKEDDNE
jgi:general secretion pathway protein J